MRRLLVPGALATGVALAISGFADPYDPAQWATGCWRRHGYRRIGRRWSRRFGGRSDRRRCRRNGRGGHDPATAAASLLSASAAAALSPTLIREQTNLCADGRSVSTKKSPERWMSS
jgi:hypothetical protein